MEPDQEMTPAETALSLLFRKLHPLLEDAAHLVDRGAAAAEFDKLHLKLQKARGKVVDVLEETIGSVQDEALAEALDTLAANLTPMGESLQQSLVLTQLCLEEAPADLLPHVSEEGVAQSAWGTRLAEFQARLRDPSFLAQQRWASIEEDIGETEEE